MPEVLRLTAFPVDDFGGNPAGAVLDATGLSDAEQQAIAAEVGYSETAFLLPLGGRRYRARYFSPAAEVPFCGHATVASAVALARRDGPGEITFDTPVGEVVIETNLVEDRMVARFTSVEPEIREADPDAISELLGLLGLDPEDLDPSLPVLESFAGNWHPVIAVVDADTFDTFSFEPAPLADLMLRQAWTGTVMVIFRRRPWLIEARNLFPVGGITEDPATGSAAASLGGYLRFLGDPPKEFDIHQGSHVGSPSLLKVEVPASGGIKVSGTAIELG